MLVDHCEQQQRIRAHDDNSRNCSRFTTKVGECGVVTPNFPPAPQNVCMQRSKIQSPSSAGFDTSISPSMPDWRLTGTPVLLACRRCSLPGGVGLLNMLPPTVAWGQPSSSGNTRTTTDALGAEFRRTPPMCFGARLKVPMKCGTKALPSSLPTF